MEVVMMKKIIMDERLRKRITAIHKEATMNRNQKVPDMFIEIAIDFAEKQQNERIYLGREIYAIAQQLHREWLLRRKVFCGRTGYDVLHVVSPSPQPRF